MWDLSRVLELAGDALAIAVVLCASVTPLRWVCWKS